SCWSFCTGAIASQHGAGSDCNDAIPPQPLTQPPKPLAQPPPPLAGATRPLATLPPPHSHRAPRSGFEGLSPSEVKGTAISPLDEAMGENAGGDEATTNRTGGLPHHRHPPRRREPAALRPDEVDPRRKAGAAEREAVRTDGQRPR